VRIDAITAVRPATDCGLHVHSGERQDAKRKRQRHQILGELHRFPPFFDYRLVYYRFGNRPTLGRDAEIYHKYRMPLKIGERT
jgi:hypothetical protein